MPRSRFARGFLILFVVVTISTSSAWGAPRRWSSEIVSFDILARAWNSLVAIWSESGCNLDPHGGYTTTQTDNGCHIDPHGGCATAQDETDAGCTADPHGGCVPGS